MVFGYQLLVESKRCAELFGDKGPRVGGRSSKLVHQSRLGRGIEGTYLFDFVEDSGHIGSRVGGDCVRVRQSYRRVG